MSNIINWLLFLIVFGICGFIILHLGDKSPILAAIISGILLVSIVTAIDNFNKSRGK